MSLEKCFAVYYPLKSKTVCIVKTAEWATGIVGIMLAAYNSVQFVANESRFSKSYGHYICVAIFDLHVFNSVDAVFYSFGPFVIMFITNFAIVFKLIRAKCQSNSTESTNQTLAKAATRGTAMVVTISVMFLVLTTLTAVNQALLEVIPLQDDPIYFVFMIFTQYLNHSINGVLYCIVGTRFRKEFLKILCRKGRGSDISTSHSINNTSLSMISGSRV